MSTLETSVRLTYSKVLVNGECVADFFVRAGRII